MIRAAPMVPISGKQTIRENPASRPLRPLTARNEALTSAVAEISFANGVSLGARFDGEFARRSTTYAGMDTFRHNG